jgi:GNAT superfamily N-acetyltransferase
VVGGPNDHDVLLRPATVADVDTIVRQRRLMFTDMGRGSQSELDAMDAAGAPFLRSAIGDGSYRGWLVEVAGRVVAGGGVWITGFPPGPLDPATRRAWILNMYTEPEYRRRGLARRLMETMIGWCREQGFVFVALHASDDGRPLYELLGFTPTNEMRLMLGARESAR